MSDAEYDSLEAQLKGMVKENPAELENASALTTVGSDLPLFAGQPFMIERQAENRLNRRIAHLVPMLSIENFYTIDDLCAWAESLGWPVLSVGSKLDGVSDSLVYEDGPLTLALTRGDGASGEVVLSQMLAAGAVPASIPTNTPIGGGRVEIRGEVVVPESKLRALNAELEAAGAKTYSTSRNLAAGTLKLLDLEEVKRRGIQFWPWDVVLPGGAVPDSGVERLKAIAMFGFAPTDDRIVTNRAELVEAVEELLLTLQGPGAEIGKDGIVIKVDSHALREKLGRGSKFTRYQICFKPQNQKAETVIRSVDWQVGRTGKVTPVANVDMVVLGGAKTARATLNNITWLTTLGVRVGSTVEVIRSGDVIPKVAAVLENPPDSTPIEAIAACPGCGHELYERADEDSEGTAYECKNDECKGRICAYLTYISDRTVLEIDGLGDELAKRLYETGIVKRFSDALVSLLEFQTRIEAEIHAQGKDAVASIFERKGLPVALTFSMVESLEKAKTASWPHWLAAMTIPLVGRRFGKAISNRLKLQPDDFPDLPAKLAAIKVGEISGLGEVRLGNVHKFANNPARIKLCYDLFNYGVRPAATEPALAGVTQTLTGVAFVITGEFEEFGARDEITAKLESLGAVSKSGVSKNVTHLIVGTDPGKSKLKKAEALGIRQVGAEWLKQTLA